MYLETRKHHGCGVIPRDPQGQKNDQRASDGGIVSRLRSHDPVHDPCPELFRVLGPLFAKSIGQKVGSISPDSGKDSHRQSDKSSRNGISQLVHKFLQAQSKSLYPGGWRALNGRWPLGGGFNDLGHCKGTDQKRDQVKPCRQAGDPSRVPGVGAETVNSHKGKGNAQKTG